MTHIYNLHYSAEKTTFFLSVSKKDSTDIVIFLPTFASFATPNAWRPRQKRKSCVNGDDCKQPSAALCEGCLKALCTKHFADHRRSLGEEMDAIIYQHDQFQNTLNQQTTNSDSCPLIKQIDDWEKESIIKIQQKAKEIREQLLNLTTAHMVDLSKKLRNVSEKLKEGREHDSFVETDLQQWKTTIRKSGRKFCFAFNVHYQSTP